jgi:hypothetical protein
MTVANSASGFGQQQFDTVCAFGFGSLDIWLKPFYRNGVSKHLQRLRLQPSVQNDFFARSVSCDLKLELCVALPNALSDQRTARVVRDTKKFNLPSSLWVNTNMRFGCAALEFKNLIQLDLKGGFAGKACSQQQNECGRKGFHAQSLNLEPFRSVNPS